MVCFLLTKGALSLPASRRPASRRVSSVASARLPARAPPPRKLAFKVLEPKIGRNTSLLPLNATDALALGFEGDDDEPKAARSPAPSSPSTSEQLNSFFQNSDSYKWICAAVFTLNIVMMGVEARDLLYFTCVQTFTAWAARCKAPSTGDYPDLPTGSAWPADRFALYEAGGHILGMVGPFIAALLCCAKYDPLEVYYILSPITSVVCVTLFMEKVAKRFVYSPTLRIFIKFFMGLNMLTVTKGALSLLILTATGGVEGNAEGFTIQGVHLWGLVLLMLGNVAYWTYYTFVDVALGRLPALFQPKYRLTARGVEKEEAAAAAAVGGEAA